MAERAREKFAIGQRVRSTPAAAASGLWPDESSPRTGVVCGFGRLGRNNAADSLVRVRVDGQLHVYTYRMDFWVVVDEDEGRLHG